MTLAIIFDSVGFGEWFVLLAVVLIVVGPKRLPETARKLGAYYSKFRRAADSFKRQLMDMDTEFTRAAENATSDVRGAFASEGDESSAMPSSEPPAEPSPGPAVEPPSEPSAESSADAGPAPAEEPAMENGEYVAD